MKDCDYDGWDLCFFNDLLHTMKSTKPVVRREDSISSQSSTATEAEFFSSDRSYSDSRSSLGSPIVSADESAENCFYYDHRSLCKIRDTDFLATPSSRLSEADIPSLEFIDSPKTNYGLSTVTKVLQSASRIDAKKPGYIEKYPGNKKHCPSIVDRRDLPHLTMPGIMRNKMQNPDTIMDTATPLQDFINYGDDLSEQGTSVVNTEMKASSLKQNGHDAQTCFRTSSTLAATQCGFQYQPLKDYHDSSTSAIPMSVLSQKGAVMSSWLRKPPCDELALTLDLCVNPNYPCAAVASLDRTSRESGSQIRDQQPGYAPNSSLPRRSFDGRPPHFDLGQSTSKLPSKDSPNTASDSQTLPKPRKIISNDHKSKHSRRCRIFNCQADMSTQTAYNKRRRLCKACMNARYVLVDGKAMRYCQQCSQLHQIELFDGQQRSCRAKLRQHRRRIMNSRTKSD